MDKKLEAALMQEGVQVLALQANERALLEKMWGLKKDAESLRHIAAVAHCGGLRGLSDADALVAIRRLSLAAWDKAGNVEHMRRMVSAALRAADAGGATRQPPEPA